MNDLLANATIAADTGGPLADAPLDEKQLLEVVLSWPDEVVAAEADRAWAAARLRVFLITWDPFDGMTHAQVVYATVRGAGDDAQIRVYVPVWTAQAVCNLGDGTVAGALGQITESVVQVAAANRGAIAGGESVAELFAGDIAAAAQWPAPSARPAGDGWDDIGLEVLEDLVAAALGPVALDRTVVVLDPLDEVNPHCPACAGKTFGFPGELSDAEPELCPVHQERARAIIAQRLRTAQESNPAGWEAIGNATVALQQVHLTGGLYGRIMAAFGQDALPSLVVQARSAMALGREVAGRRLELEGVFGEDLPMVAEWVSDLPDTLAANDLVDAALAVADAWAITGGPVGIDFAVRAALVAAGAGRVEEARARAEAFVEAGRTQPAAHLSAGQIYEALGDGDAAEAAYRRAAALAGGQGGDRAVFAAALDRLETFLESQPGREGEAEAVRMLRASTAQRDSVATDYAKDLKEARERREAEERMERLRAPKADKTGTMRRPGPKPGRNDPCVCGSGKKLKDCCG